MKWVLFFCPFLLILPLMGCDDEESALSCAADQVALEGACVSAHSLCGEGLQWDGQACAPTGSLCGEGLQWDGQNCMPTETLCGEGLRWDGQACVVDAVEGSCGDGLLSEGEECEDGNQVSGDGCSEQCVLEYCGDGVTNDVDETCDDGNATSGDGCDPSCQLESCGDGLAIWGVEECDDGNITSGDGCSEHCVLEFCGDGVVNDAGAEECDDGNEALGDGCTDACVLEFCGDGVVNNNDERCDDGNTIPGDGCSAGCQVEFCGDGAVNLPFEECDDGNVASGDGCDLNCVVEYCGDGVTNNVTESCDDGNDVDDDLCPTTCVAEWCGDGIVQDDANEECDDGNQIPGDGCTGCRISSCGDAILTEGEGCDDGNIIDGDGCNAGCLWECPGDLTEDNLYTQAVQMTEGVEVQDQLCGDVMTVGEDRVDWHSFQVHSGQSFLTVVNSSHCSHLWLELLDGSGQRVTRSVPTPGICPALRLNGLSPGTYYLGVHVVDGVTGVLPYSLMNMGAMALCGDGAAQGGELCDDGNDVAGDGCFDCQVECEDDAYEDNDSLDSAWPLVSKEVELEAVLCQSDLNMDAGLIEDHYGVELEAGETLVVSTAMNCMGLHSLRVFEEDPALPGSFSLIAEEHEDSGCPAITVPSSEEARSLVVSVSTSPFFGTIPYTLTVDHVVPTCGDQILELGEGCDDGNLFDHDGCNALCEPEYCGDGIITPNLGERCDDGNQVSGDGCNPHCQVEAYVPDPTLFALCSTTGPHINGLYGTLTCADMVGNLLGDRYLVSVQAGQCVDIHVDNGQGAADLFAAARTPDGLFTYGLANDYSQLDDEAVCSYTPASGFACPSASIMAPEDGQIEVWVAQWGGGCTNNSEYFLYISIDGIPTVPVLDAVAQPYP